MLVGRGCNDRRFYTIRRLPPFWRRMVDLVIDVNEVKQTKDDKEILKHGHDLVICSFWMTLSMPAAAEGMGSDCSASSR